MAKRTDPVITVRLSRLLLEKLDMFAKRHGISRNRAILLAVVGLMSADPESGIIKGP